MKVFINEPAQVLQEVNEDDHQYEVERSSLRVQKKGNVKRLRRPDVPSDEEGKVYQNQKDGQVIYF